jgi:hypothetical protein
MAKKITLTVNENLFKQIDAWRSSFNLSRLFQDAVSEAIRRKEEFQHLLSGSADLPRIVERLKAEKLDLLERASSAGKADGSAWAGRAHYEELTTAVRSIPGTTAAEDKATEAWEAHHKMAVLEGKPRDDAVAAYRAGWRTGVMGLWDLVKEQLGEE